MSYRLRSPPCLVGYYGLRANSKYVHFSCCMYKFYVLHYCFSFLPFTSPYFLLLSTSLPNSFSSTHSLTPPSRPPFAQNPFSYLISNTSFKGGFEHWSKEVWVLGYKEFDFFRQLRTQTLWWVQKLNLRHIYLICFLFFLFLVLFFECLASKFEKSTNMTLKQIFCKNNKKRYQKTQNFMLISNPLKILKCINKSYKQNKFDEYE